MHVSWEKQLANPDSEPTNLLYTSKAGFQRLYAIKGSKVFRINPVSGNIEKEATLEGHQGFFKVNTTANICASEDGQYLFASIHGNIWRLHPYELSIEKHVRIDKAQYGTKLFMKKQINKNGSTIDSSQWLWVAADSHCWRLDLDLNVQATNMLDDHNLTGTSLHVGDKGMCFVGGYGHMVALDAVDLSYRWHDDLKGTGNPPITFASDHDMLYVGAGGHLLRFEQTSGGVKERNDLPGMGDGTTNVVKDPVYRDLYLGQHGKAAAFWDGKINNRMYQNGLKGCGYGFTAVAIGTDCAFYACNGRLYQIRKAASDDEVMDKMLFDYSWDEKVSNDLAFVVDNLLIMSAGNKLMGIGGFCANPKPDPNMYNG